MLPAHGRGQGLGPFLFPETPSPNPGAFARTAFVKTKLSRALNAHYTVAPQTGLFVSSASRTYSTVLAAEVDVHMNRTNARLFYSRFARCFRVAPRATELRRPEKTEELAPGQFFACFGWPGLVRVRREVNGLVSVQK